MFFCKLFVFSTAELNPFFQMDPDGQVQDVQEPEGGRDPRGREGDGPQAVGPVRVSHNTAFIFLR